MKAHFGSVGFNFFYCIKNLKGDFVSLTNNSLQTGHFVKSLHYLGFASVTTSSDFFSFCLFAAFFEPSTGLFVSNSFSIVCVAMRPAYLICSSPKANPFIVC